ncbi:nucleotidyltransferase domain-containing protein [bacterium]|nr:nucleotidyltransferase domain-containing protein [bacterium]
MAKREKLALDRLSISEAEAVRTFVRAVNERFPGMATRIVLFGSKARADSQAESDIDVLVVVRQEDWRISNAISTLAARISLEQGVLLGPIVIGQERWERMGREKFSLYRNVAREGLVLEEGGAISTAA